MGVEVCVRMKERWINLVLRFSVVFIPLVMGFVIVSTTLLMLGNYRVTPFAGGVTSLVSGVFLWYCGMVIKNRARFYFSATFLVLTGLLLIVLDLDLFLLTARETWPILMLFVGSAFTVSGYLHYRKIHALYFVPSLVFSTLGFVFLLFTTDIIAVSLRSVVLWWFPLLFIPSLVSLVVWIIQRKRKVGTENE